MRKDLIALSLILLLPLVFTYSDTHGNNPQHDFGEVFGSGSLNPFKYWQLEGDAHASQNFVRLTEDRQSKKGRLWNKIPNEYKNWELVIKMKVSGKGAVGADGIAFWYVADKHTPNEDFFGFREDFRGLGIVIDTYDNDGTGDHPRLMGLYNKNGDLKFSHSHDHDHREGSMEIGGCQFNLRNSNDAVWVRITYENGIIEVATDSGDGNWNNCFSTTKTYELPTGNYFGFSAATGDLADNHDIYGVSIINLDRNARSLDPVSKYADEISPSELIGHLSKIEHALRLGHDYSKDANYASTVINTASKMMKNMPKKQESNGCELPSSSFDRLQRDVKDIEGKIDQLANTIQLKGSKGGQETGKNYVTEKLEQYRQIVLNIQTKVNNVQTPTTKKENFHAPDKISANPNESSSWLWNIIYILLVSLTIYLARFLYLEKFSSKPTSLMD